MQAGAFSQELSWFVGAGGWNFPRQDDIQVVTTDEHPRNGGNERVEVILKLQDPDHNQDPDRKSFDVPLVMENKGGRWIVLDSANSMAAAPYFTNGLALLNNGELDRAVLEFHKGLLLDPTDFGPHIDLGRAVHQQSLQAAARGAEVDVLKKYAEIALFEFQVALALKPDSPSTHYFVGLGLHDDDKLDDAINELFKAVQLDPKNARSHRVLAEFLRERGRPEDAPNVVDELRRACDLYDQESCDQWNQMNPIHD
jgi:tetratricopeptide (TPR) repeat protein